MKKELCEQLAEKAKQAYATAIRTMFEGDPQLRVTAKDQKAIERVWKEIVGEGALKAALRKIPNSRFEELNAKYETLPGELRKALKEGLGKLTRLKGGRPTVFPAEIRLRAIQDLGHEQIRRPFKQAVELVAQRYGMTPDYLRKVWKNRSRLRNNI